MPLISVIVPCYNQAQYLDECLQSVLDQTYKDWECIIVNDGSPDHTEEVAKRWVVKDARFRYLYKENGGLSSARNAGIAKAKGEYVFFLDCDDQLSDDSAFALYAKHLEEGNYDFIASNIQEVYYDRVIIKSYFNNKVEKSKILIETAIITGFLDKTFSVIACNKLIKKEVLRQHNLSFVQNIYHEDELFMFNLSLICRKILLLKEITYNYNKSNPSSIMRMYSLKNLEDIVFIIKNLYRISDDYNLISIIGYDKLYNHVRNLSFAVLNNKLLLNNKQLWIKFYHVLARDYKNSQLSVYRKQYFFYSFIEYYMTLLKLYEGSNYLVLLIQRLFFKIQNIKILHILENDFNNNGNK